MTLFTYVLREFFKYVLLTVVLCLFLFVMFDFIQKASSYFAVHKPSNAAIVQYYVYQIPGFLLQALPIASLLSSVVTMVLLSRTNEITAMRAAGMGPLAIALPIAVGGFCLSAITLLSTEYLVPWGAERVHYVEDVLIEKKPKTETMDGVHWVRDGHHFFHFETYDPYTATMSRVQLVDVGRNFRPETAREAPWAKYDPAAKKWSVPAWNVLHFNASGAIVNAEVKGAETLTLPVEPQKLKKQRRQPNEMAAWELRDVIRRGESTGVDVSSFKVEFHIQFAYALSAFIVSLIGLKFGYRSERSLETAKGILVAFAIGISYWFILNAGRALGKRGDVSPFLAAWLADFLVMGFTAIELWRTRKT